MLRQDRLKRPEAGSIPDAPGSYQFLDAEGRVVYVGKAKSLRSRLSNYFGSHLPLRTRQMVDSAVSVEWIQVDNEVEALMLEFSLIQRHRPRFNVRYTDDKSYPFLCVTMRDEWPRAMVMRGRRLKGNRYFGPYGHAYAIRDTLDLLLRTFPIRTCTDGKFRRYASLGKPCLLYHIEKCSGPCVGEVSTDDYADMVAELLRFLEGDSDPVLDRLNSEMAAAADDLDYERAARLRDRLAAVRKAIETQQMVGSRNEDFDVIGMVDDALEAAVQVFFVRRGRVMGRRGFMIDKAEDLDRAELVSRALERLYLTTTLWVGRSWCWPPNRPPRPASTPNGSPRCGAHEWRSGFRSEARNGRCKPPSPATPRSPSPGTGSSAAPTTTAGPERSTSCSSTWRWPRPRCASSATT